MSAPPRRGKGKIKPPRKHIGPDTNHQETWTKLSNAIREIQNHNVAHLSFEENYRLAYNLVLHRQGGLLYDGVNALVVENLDKLARESIVPTFPVPGASDSVQESQEGARLLMAFREVWDDHIGNMSKLGALLKYMDRVYTQSARVPVINDAGLQHFLDRIIRSPVHSIRQHLLSTVLCQIRLERDGYPINRSAVKGCIDVFRTLKDPRDVSNAYKLELEPDILRESEEFYRKEGEELLATCDAPEYLRRAEHRLDSERSRATHYLPLTVDAIIEILKAHLLTPHLATVISMPNSGLDSMIDASRETDLERLYRLYTMVPTGLAVLRKALKESIAQRGKRVNEADGGDGDMEIEEDEDIPVSKGKGKEKAKPRAAQSTLTLALKWVQDVLDLKDMFDRILKVSFHDDKAIQVSFNEALESFINLHPRAPEYISLFIDENLKKGLKGKTDDEVDAVLDKTITIFRFVTDKDVFERYYKSHLAKRLLTGRSVSDDAERGMLAKLKVECGFQFTQKLEGMFHDIKISGDTMVAYRSHIAKTTAPPIEISVQVLTSTFWPMSQATAACTFSEDMDRACNSFSRFYLSRHTGRRLTWQPSLGNADVRVTFKSKSHDLNVSTYALVVLLLFQDLGFGESLSYEDIKTATSIGDSDLQRNLQSLACAKFKILKKHPPGRDVNLDDSFSFNDDFSSSLQRIKISTIANKVESVDQRKETREKVDEERKLQMEACIVRVMKDRKTMSHNDLINEVTRQLASRFLPNPTHIKKRIEALLDRDYLDRGEDKKSYIYVA